MVVAGTTGSVAVEAAQEVLEYCFKHSPYYRQLWTSLGVDPRDWQSLSELHQLPITSREMMRNHADQIRSTVVGLETVSKSTGGSSGTPLHFVIDCEANDRRTAAAFVATPGRAAAPGTKQTHLWGVALGKHTRLQDWKEYLHSRFLYRRQMLNSFDLSDDSIPLFLDRIYRFQPEVFVAYTNPLYWFARAIEQRGLEAYRPKAMIVGAEKLHDFQRDALESVFCAPVFETYGSREFSLIGAECPRHSGLHLTMENLLVEVVDEEGRPTPAGEEGNIVITDLFNIAMPFVRYAIGDRAISGFGTCPCGRGLPLLKKVVGRHLDILVTADGHRLAGEFFPHLLKNYSPYASSKWCKANPISLK